MSTSISPVLHPTQITFHHQPSQLRRLIVGLIGLQQWYNTTQISITGHQLVHHAVSGHGPRPSAMICITSVSDSRHQNHGLTPKKTTNSDHWIQSLSRNWRNGFSGSRMNWAGKEPMETFYLDFIVCLPPLRWRNGIPLIWPRSSFIQPSLLSQGTSGSVEWGHCLPTTTNIVSARFLFWLASCNGELNLAWNIVVTVHDYCTRILNSLLRFCCSSLQFTVNSEWCYILRKWIMHTYCTCHLAVSEFY